MFTGVGHDYGDDRPLDEALTRILISNLVHLIDRIDPNVAFVTELANVGCIVWRQREHLLSLDSSCDRNVKLIEFLTRRSVADYKQFIQVVARGEQSHLVHLLLPGGGQDILSHFMYNCYVSNVCPLQH